MLALQISGHISVYVFMYQSTLQVFKLQMVYYTSIQNYHGHEDFHQILDTLYYCCPTCYNHAILNCLSLKGEGVHLQQGEDVYILHPLFSRPNL